MGLGLIYKRQMLKEDLTEAEKASMSWVRNKILHAYYRTSLEDRYDQIIICTPVSILYVMMWNSPLKNMFLIVWILKIS